MERPPATETKVTEQKKGHSKELTVGLVALGVTILACVAVVYYWNQVIELGSYGYAGLFIISILAGGTVVVPVPGLLLVFTLGSVLSPAIVGAVAGLGEAVGSMAIYLTGYSGRHVFNVDKNGMYNRMAGWLERRGTTAVFINSAIFNPLFYPFTAVAGMLHFGMLRFFIFCWAGKTVKNLVVAYAGYFGLRTLLRYFGLPV